MLWQAEAAAKLHKLPGLQQRAERLAQLIAHRLGGLTVSVNEVDRRDGPPIPIGSLRAGVCRYGCMPVSEYLSVRFRHSHRYHSLSQCLSDVARQQTVRIGGQGS